ISGSTNLEFRKTKHLYLKLGSLEGRLREWIEKRDWNKLVRGIANKWLKEGLESRAITRDLSWGVPVPLDVWPDMAGKVFYVWFDAPIAYISMTKDFIGEDYLKWWSADSGDTYYEFMGKDNVPFHTIFFPAMLMATEKPWKLVDYVCGQSFLNYKGGKFSKSAKRGIFADAAIAEFPEIDYLRWTLIKNIPETDDSDFSFEIMAGDVNSDLNNVLGNLCLRVAKFYAGKIGTVVAHDFTGELGIEEQVANFHRLMEAREFKKAVAELRRIWAIGNEFIDRAAPWSVFKTDPAAAGEMLVRAMNIVVVGAALAQPFIPRLAQRVLDIFGLRVDGLNAIPRIGAGVKLAVPEVLFEKITPERVAELDEKYK
ncbi:MAG: class I tRNA ligase family protein, partial [Alphaproteobacteria bacterium]|nr:class I tRNA ligase family protein [Alphaproteobacteria bacterium]